MYEELFDPGMVSIYLIIAPKRFHFVKFLLEGYDNLAIISMIDNKKGLIRIKCTTHVIKELFALFSSISETIKRPCL